MTYRVTGTGLLSLVNDIGGEDKTKLITMAGYIRPDGKLAYIDFYQALLEAKTGGPLQLTYDEEDYSKEWCRCIAKHLPDVDEQDARDWVAKQLEDLGIETEEQLTEAFWGVFDTWSFYEGFGQDYLENYCEPIPEILEGCIDYEALWDSLLRHDYNTFEFGGNTYVFRSDY
jgi:hypothetical protein